MRAKLTRLRALGLAWAAAALLVGAPAHVLAADGDRAASESASLLALTSRVYPLVDAPQPVGISWCQAANPQCTPTGWWQERDQKQSGDLVQFSYLEPGLASEARFAEAVGLLSLWPEGQFLLHQAAMHGVAIVSWPDAHSGNAYGSYTARFRLVRINNRFAQAPTWLLSTLLAHELKHAADDRAGAFDIAETGDCLAAERSAFGAQARFLTWLDDRQKGLPGVSQALQAFTPDDFAMYADALTMADPDEMDALLADMYADECGSDFDGADQ